MKVRSLGSLCASEGPCSISMQRLDMVIRVKVLWGPGWISQLVLFVPFVTDRSRRGMGQFTYLKWGERAGEVTVAQPMLTLAAPWTVRSWNSGQNTGVGEPVPS